MIKPQIVYALRRTNYPQAEGQTLVYDYKHKSGQWFTDFARHIRFFENIHLARIAFEKEIEIFKKKDPDGTKFKLEIIKVKIQEIEVCC